MKTAFPLSASIMSGFAKLLFDTLIRSLFVMLVMVTTLSIPEWQFVLMPLVLIPAMLLFIGSGLLLGVLNVIYKDVSRVVSIALQYGIFVSGVIFPLNSIGFLSVANKYNPFAVFIDASRSIVFQGSITNLTNFALMSLFALATFLLAVRVFYVMEHRIRGIT